MKLVDLFKNGISEIQKEMKFQGLASDSRQVTPGGIFVAVSCDQIVDHVVSALKKGAQAIVIESATLEQNHLRLPKASYIPVKDARRSLSQLAQEFYPNQPQMIAAITGTNGKSSVTTFVRQLWELLGIPAASFGTLGLETPQETLDNFPSLNLTTPDAIYLHRLLQEVAQAGIQHFVFEASSHGLDQYRLHGAKVKVAGFTNLTHDHLDYHETMETYFEAKSKLFTEVLRPGGVAVLNNESTYAKSLSLLALSHGVQVVTYGINRQADLRACPLQSHQTSIEFNLHYQGRSWNGIHIPVVGSFQVENILCAIGMLLAEGIELESIVSILPHLQSAQGRMQLAGTTHQGAAVYIDYAHTPDALSRALISLKSHLAKSGKLHVVFGCGGNRDTGKRQAMGAVAHSFADIVYITDDNPRREDPSFIRAQILSGCPKGQEIPNRFIAIETALKGLTPHDILLIAGKGHENGQIIGLDLIPFNDAQVVGEILKNKRGDF